MTVNKLKISPMAAQHAPALAALEREQFSAPWTLSDFQHTLTDEYTDYFVAENDRVIAGYIGLRFGGDTADITTFCVAPPYRRQGVGQSLLAYATSYAARKGCQKVFLEVRESNIPARALYEKNGFCFVSKRKRYYKNPEEDAWVLIKEIVK